MKNILACFLLFYSLSGIAQETTVPAKSGVSTAIDSNILNLRKVEQSTPIYTEYHPDKKSKDIRYMVDSINVADFYINYIDAKDILAVNVIKNDQYSNGMIDIKVKDHILLLKLIQSKILSLRDIVTKYIDNNSRHKPIIFFMNKELVTDTAGVRIPDMCLVNITVAKASQMHYYKTAFPDALIMMITTRPASNEPYQAPIYIRGSAIN